MIEWIERATAALNPGEPWRMAPGESLPERVRRRKSPLQTIFQWLAHIITVAALISGRTWLLLLAAFVFYLQWRGASTSHRYAALNLSKLSRLDTDSPGAEPVLPGVTLIAPARDEEGQIERAARSWAALDYEPLDVIIVNDHSTDTTPEILDRVAHEYPHLRVFHDPPPAPGWIGKPNAIRHALEHANPEHPWLLFIDADTVFHPAALRAAVAQALCERVDFLTCLPTLETGGLAERLMLPALWRGIACSIPRERLDEPDAYPVGIGAFMLVRREVYERSGGHARYPNLHSDDTLLAGVVKEAGGRVDLALSGSLLSIRLYTGLHQVFRAAVIKSRTYSGDRVLPTLASFAVLALPAALPLPLALIAFAQYAAGSPFDWAHGLYIVSALAAYVQRSLAYRGIEVVSDTTPHIGWLHPLAGWLRVAIYSTALAQTLFRTPRRWRGRLETGEDGKL
jgi:glycosyltransferase involved in cell wall biosynthesis